MGIETKSILQVLGLPGTFGLTLLGMSLILTLAPYFAGLDFGVLKVPDFSHQWRRKLKWLGPIILLLMIFIHIPLFSTTGVQKPEDQIAVDDSKDTHSETDSRSKVDTPDAQGTSSQESKPEMEDESDVVPGQNKVEAKIVEEVKTGMPHQVQSITTLSSDRGEVVLRGIVTVEAQTANFVPIFYLLEWVLINPQSESILLDSYRGNEKYQFTQRSDAEYTFWVVEKTIWTSNTGIYEFRVYSSDKILRAVATVLIE